MHTATPEHLRELIRDRLTSHERASMNSIAVADSTVELWRQLALRLSPLIGPDGVDVLFRRALHLTTRTFPWLSHTGESDPGALQAQLKSQDPTVAAEAGVAVLVRFVELLESLIGDELSEQLLAPIWESPTEMPNQEITS